MSLGNWIDVADGLPDDDETVIVHHPDLNEPVWLGYHDAGAWFNTDGDMLADGTVKHWQRMPDPPTAVQYIEFELIERAAA